MLTSPDAEDAGLNAATLASRAARSSVFRSTRSRFQRWIVCASLGFAGAMHGQDALHVGEPGSGPESLDAVVVTAARSPQAPERVAASTYLFTQRDLTATPTVSLDSVLRTAPGFSLFRRSDSLVAHPTAQGVSLRGLGPSGASRSLVLLDGVPLNDPFGGWVNWSKVPRDAVARVEVVPGGGSSAWGNAALGGVIQILTFPARLPRSTTDESHVQPRFGEDATVLLSATVGAFGLHSASVGATVPVGPGIAQVFAEDFAFDGYAIIARERRGQIDIPAWSRHRSITARYRLPAGEKAQLAATVRGFEESRGNGTPYQRNGTREKFASLQFAAEPIKSLAWMAAAYVQGQSFASTFSAVNGSRTAETPASEQYAVPSTAFGASATGVWTHSPASKTSGGLDVRSVQGETRENFTFVNAQFTRERVAGGGQQIAGGFVFHEYALTKTVRLSAAGRVDRWSDRNGHRRELDRASRLVTRDERYASIDDVEFSPSVGAVWTPTSAWRLRANAQQSFRRPTLNELYRPFRQGPNVTEANAALKTEHASSGEIGAEFSVSQPMLSPSERRKTPTGPAPERWLTFGGTLFWNELTDAVANVTVARGPGTFPVVGTLPAGGVGRQRLNLDRVVVQGGELSATWSAATWLEVKAAYLRNQAEVREASVAPALAGKRLAEVPRDSASFSADWRPSPRLHFTPRARWIGRQFDDDENTLRLGEVVVLDVGASYSLTKQLELFLGIENLGNARIETARTADGVVSVGTPRFAFGGVRGRW